MNRLRHLTALIAAFAAGSAAAASYYFDVNGAISGSGVTSNGSYNATGSVWSGTTDGTGAPVALPGRQGVVFSAGVDATSQAYTVAGTFGQVSGGIIVQEGNVTLSGGGTFYSSQTVQTSGVGTSLAISTTPWDFYNNTVTFQPADGCPITLNSIATISGRGGSLIKTGAGLLTVTGDATARGISVAVNNGELRILTGNAFYNSSYPPPTKIYTVSVNSGGTWSLSGNLTVANNPATLAGPGYNNAGALLALSGNSSFTQLLTLSGDTRIAADSGASLTLNPLVGDAITGAFALTIGGSGNVTVSKPISSVTSLTKDGAGTLTLSAVNPFTGSTLVSAGTLALAESGGALGGVGGAITLEATLQITSVGSQSLANVISGPASGQLTKLGAGVLTLTAVNPFAGSVLVGAGRLSLASASTFDAASIITMASGAFFDVSAVSGYTLKNGQTLAGAGTVAGAVTAQSGSQLSPGTSGAPGTLTFSQPLVFAGGVTAVFDLASTAGGIGDQLAVSGNLTLSGANTIRVNYTTLANGTYPLIRTTGGTVTGAVGSLQLANFIAGTQVASLQLASGGAGLDLVVANNPYVARDLTWFGDGGANVWDAGTTSTWRASGSVVTFTASDRLTFDSNGATNATVTLAGQLAPGAVTVTGSTDYTLTGGGSLVGSMVLTKSGTGRLVLTGDHAFTGGTTVTGGTVEVRSSAGLGKGAVANGGTLVFAPTTTLTFANVIAGAGTLSQISGVATLSGANTFTGALGIIGGMLKIGHASALGSTAGATSIGAGGTLDLNGFSIGAEPVTLAGGALTNSSAAAASFTGPLTLTADSSITGTGALTLSGALGGNFTLTKTGAHTLTLSGGGGTRTGTLAVGAGSLLVTGNAGPGPVTIASGATLGGNGTLGGALTVGGTLDPGVAVATLTVSGNLTLQSTATTRLKIQKGAGGLTADRIVVGGTLTRNGTLVVSIGGLALTAGDSVQLFSAASATGEFASVQLPYLYGDLIWDRSALNTTGTVSVIALPAVSTVAQRRDWLLTRAAESPGAVDGSVMAAAYFARGDIAQGQALALSTSRSILANYQVGAAQVDLFDYWPALDLAIRYGQYLDEETKANIKEVVTHFTQYKDTNTANLQTLAWTVRYLGGELYGEGAFTSLGLANYWRTNDVNARAELLSQFVSRATTGYPEFASRPYFWKDILPFLSVGQLSQDPVMRLKATLSVEAGFAQYAGSWMRGHLGIATGRSYPDVLDQFPVTSLGMLWFYYGGDVPALNTESAVFTAVMNQPISNIISLAGSDRTTGFRARSYLSNVHQDAYNDRDYVLFSDGPSSYGNFQVYPNGVVWCEPDLNRYSFLWVAKPWRDDSGINSSNPHGRNTACYKEAQSRDAVAYIYNIPATGDAFPYALGYVPGGYRAMVNDSTTAGNVFLHYGTVLIAIRSENTFTWNPSSGIAFPAAPAATGDSEFRIYGTRFAVAVETAHPADYAGATPADQLAAFRADILAKTTLGRTAAATPTALYTTRRGDTIQVALSKDPATRPGTINGLPTNYNNWPMLENRWMYQRVNDPLLTLATSSRREVLDFTAWTRTVQTAPSVSGPASALSATAGVAYDVDLGALTQSPAGDTRPLSFDASAASQGTVSILADGHTARFTPAVGYTGSAAFSFTAHAAGINPAALVFFYDYESEDLADNLVSDHSGHRLDATVSTAGGGTRTLATDVPSAIAGVSAASLQLNEATSTAARLTHVLSVTEHDLSDADWTFATWVKRSATINDDFILYLGTGDGFGGTGDELQLYFPAGANTLRLQHYSSANLLDLDLVSATTATAGVWHHVAVSFTRTGLNTGIVRLYLNGALSATSSTVTWTLNQTSSLVLGGCATTTGPGPAHWLNGGLDDTVLFNRALSTAELARLATQSVAHFTGLTAGATVNFTVTTALDQWRQQYFGTTANTSTAADTADYDGDGASNLIEYALGTTPTSAASVSVPTAQVSGLKLQITFQRARSDLTYVVEASSSLAPGSWTVIATNPGTVGQSVTVIDTFNINTANPPRRFLRLRVTTP